VGSLWSEALLLFAVNFAPLHAPSASACNASNCTTSSSWLMGWLMGARRSAASSTLKCRCRSASMCQCADGCIVALIDVDVPSSPEASAVALVFVLLFVCLFSYSSETYVVVFLK